MLKLGNEWLVRALVLLSLAAHLVLVLLAGTRRRRASGVRRALLWPCYLVAGWAATHSISNLMLGVITSREQRLHAFWATFLLMHLALPDNISAYSLEDNTLSSRKMASAPAQVIGAIFILYKNFIFVQDAGTLRPASYLMFTLGIAKYIQSVWALWQGNLDTIRGSIKEMEPKGLSPEEREDHDLDNEQALLFAHGLLHISKGAFADYPFSLKTKSPKHGSAEGSKPGSHKRESAGIKVRAFSRSKGWQDMCKVVEMELSLMYDVMYTKAAVAHTRLGYCIRVISPPFTAASLLLFWSDSKVDESDADVMVTYTLLLLTLVLDVGWLLGTLGSTWTCAFLRHRPQHWLLQCLLGRCHGLIRSFGFVAVKDPTRYRLWSGTIGQYNLLNESCRGRRTSELVKMVSAEDAWMEYQYGYSESIELSQCVRDLVFQGVWEILEKAYPMPPEEEREEEGADKGAMKTANEYTDSDSDESMQPTHVVAIRAELALMEAPDLPGGLRRQGELGKILGIGPEFPELVLRWHLATEIFLLCRPRSTASCSSIECKHVKAIQGLSNYMMFLVAVRPGMLPGLNLRSMLDGTWVALDLLYRRDPQGNCSTSSPINERALAEIMRAKEEEAFFSRKKQEEEAFFSKEKEEENATHSAILSEGTFYAEVLLFRMSAYCSWVWPHGKWSEEEKARWTGPLRTLAPGLYHNVNRPLQMEEMLEIILYGWVRLLVHASTRCAPDSHAKQLSRGGDLTTVVWMLAEHAGIYGIPEDKTRTTSDRPCWSLKTIHEPYPDLQCPKKCCTFDRKMEHQLTDI